MRKSEIDKYCKIVGNKLVCSSQTRRKMLDGIREEIENLSRDGEKSFSELEDILGSTSDMAEALQCEILVEEKNEVVRKRKIIVLVASCATLALFVLGIFSYMHFWKKNNMWHIDSVIIYGNEEEAIIDDDLSNVKWFEE